MPTNWTENYLRLHLLNNEAVTVLRATFLNVVSKTCNGDVDKFLEEFEQDIKTMHKLSYTQRNILFPDNGRTNVEEWDVSLLCFILTTCCTLEGNVYIKKLRDLMKIQTNAFNDIDAFLAYNKDKIDEMRRQADINQEQYNMLFPLKFPKKTNINDWGSNLLLRMLVVFFSERNKDKVFEVLRTCIERDVRLHCQNPDLAKYLQLKQTDCLNLLQNGKISQQEYDQLFPKYGQFSDVRNWDNHLVEVFVTNVCACIGRETIDAVNVVKQIRNEMVAHNGTAEIETGEFLKIWTKLYTAVVVIIKQEVPNILQEWTQNYNKLLEGPFDMTAAINTLKENYLKESSLKDVIKELEHRIEAESKKRTAEYQQGQKELNKLMKANSAIAEKVQFLVDRDKSRDMYTEPIDAELIEVKIVVAGGTCTKEAIQKTENMLRLSIQNLLKGRTAEITIKTVNKLVEGMTQDGTEIVDVQSGSVLLKLKCINLKGITNLLVHVESREIQQHIETDLRKEMGKEIHLGCGITDESMQALNNDLNRIKTIHETRKPLVFSELAIMEQVKDDIASITIKEESTNEGPGLPSLVKPKRKGWEKVKEPKTDPEDEH